LPIKEVQGRVMPDQTSCRNCGHPRLRTVASALGDTRLWFAFCPACHNIQDRAFIPEAFLEGLPAPPDYRRLH
jgi:hypothetical protein